MVFSDIFISDHIAIYNIQMIKWLIIIHIHSKFKYNITMLYVCAYRVFPEFTVQPVLPAPSAPPCGNHGLPTPDGHHGRLPLVRILSISYCCYFHFNSKGKNTLL